MVVKRTDYTKDAVEVARSVMLEVTRLLGEYREGIVIIGGWVPELLINKAERRHVGSLDVDIALDHRLLQNEGYRSILELLQSRGYRQGEQPYIFYRTVELGDRRIEVEVDFLAGEYAGTSAVHRTQKVQNIRPRKARGCELAFAQPEEITLSGALPNGGKDSVKIRVAGIVPFIVMKSMALANRLKEKDSWDIYYCVRYFPGGAGALTKEFRPHLKNGLVREALAIIAEKFASPDHIGPVHVANFEDLSDPDGRAILQRDAFERMKAFIGELKEK